MGNVFYTNVQRRGKDILCRIADSNGGRKKVRHQFKPELYLSGQGISNPVAYGLHGEPLVAKNFDNMYEMDKWFDENRDVPGMKIFGQTDHVYQFIAHKFRGKLEFNPNVIRKANVDIEVVSGYMDDNQEFVNGPFPEPYIGDETFKTIEDARTYSDRAVEFYKWWLATFPKTRIDPLIDLNAVFPIPLIQAENMNTGECKIFGMPLPEARGKYVYDPDDEEIGGLKVEYEEFETEQELLASFVNWWMTLDPDAWTGWNIEGFDAPYIHERVRKILGDKWAQALSPWDWCKKRNVKSSWGDTTTFDFMGVETLDYIELYKKHTYVTREKYSLDHIAFCELGEKKLDYAEAKSLNRLFFMDWCKYVRYGIKDIKLVSRLDDKLKLLDLTFTLAYLTKSNYRDTLGTVSPWNAMTYNFLLDKGLRPEIKRVVDYVPDFEGGYVKEVVPGFYKWVLSVDLNSLYPHIIMQGNMGPETIIDGEKRYDIIYDLCEELESCIAKERNNPVKRRALKAILAKVREDCNDGVSHDVVDELVSLGKYEFETLKRYNVVMAPNIQFYDRSRMSIFSEIMRFVYNGRKLEKKQMLEADQFVVWCKELLSGRFNEVEAKKSRYYNEEYVDRIKVMSHDELKAEKHAQEDRSARQDNLQMGFKILMNAGYGAISNKWFRDYFDIRIAASITATGRMINKWNIHNVNRLLNSELDTNGFDFAFYGDTDSNYITMDKLVEREGWDELSIDEIVHKLDEYYVNEMDRPIQGYAQDMCDTMNGYEQKMVWEREVIAQSAVWQAPKLYIMAVNNSEGVAYETPKLKTMGVASKKSNFPQWCRDKLNDCYKTLLLGEEEQLHAKVKAIREEYMGLSVDKIAAASSVSNVEKWEDSKGQPLKGTPYNSKASILYNRLLDRAGLDDVPRIRSGDKMVMVNLREPNPINYGYIAFHDYLPPELNFEQYVDYQSTYEKTFLNPLELILAPRGWDSKKKVRLFGDRKTLANHAQGKKLAKPKPKEQKVARRLF